MLPNDNNDANTNNNDNNNNNDDDRTSGWEARICEHFVLNIRLLA